MPVKGYVTAFQDLEVTAWSIVAGVIQIAPTWADVVCVGFTRLRRAPAAARIPSRRLEPE